MQDPRNMTSVFIGCTLVLLALSTLSGCVGPDSGVMFPRLRPTSESHDNSHSETSASADRPPDVGLVSQASFQSDEFSLDSEPVRLPPVSPSHHDITYKDLYSNQTDGVISDFKEFYSREGIAWLVGGIGVGAVAANTGIDEQLVRDAYLDNIVLAPSEELYEALHKPKFLGEGKLTIPIFAIAALAEPLTDNLPFGPETAEWGQRSLRTILIGGPPVLGLQWITGGGRPGETDESSEWQPFRDNNGVSGHSFMGAVPLLSAAKMTDNTWMKAGLYAASTLPGISRINDDAHYFSQVFLGWWLAYIAESAVDRSFASSSSSRWRVGPSANSTGLTISTRW